MTAPGDYWAEFSDELKNITEFDQVLPAVSGASAVETAMMLSLLAQTNKKIIVFSGNYSGKLLLPMVATNSKIHPIAFFKPLYEHIIVIDPFSNNADEQLKAEITTNTVGLIWFEYIRGEDGEKLPNSLIDIICQYKKEYGFYIGVDEVLTGLYRTATLFSYQQTNLCPDIVTLSKGLSYMSFPIGVTLVKSDLYEKAYAKECVFLEYLSTRYINQLGASIALHCLRRIKTESIEANVVEQSNYINKHLHKIKNNSAMIEKINVNGLMISIHFKVPWWVKMMGEIGRFIYNAGLTKCWHTEANMLVVFNIRMVPSLCIGKNESDIIIAGIEKMAAMSPAKFFLSYFKPIR